MLLCMMDFVNMSVECSMLTPYFTRYGLQMLEEAAL